MPGLMMEQRLCFIQTGERGTHDVFSLSCCLLRGVKTLRAGGLSIPSLMVVGRRRKWGVDAGCSRVRRWLKPPSWKPDDVGRHRGRIIKLA